MSDQEPTRDFAKMLDLNRSQLTKDYVSEIENRLRDIQEAQFDLKAIIESALKQEYTKRDVAAMKTLARLRLRDERAAAAEKLEALNRIGKQVEFDLFDWSEAAK